MKKILISLFVILTIVTSLFVQATDDVLSEGTPTATLAPTETPTEAPETPTPTVAPTAKPSDKPPFTFTVTTTDGKNELIQDQKTDSKLLFTITPNGKEDFTILKIENDSNGTTPLNNEQFVSKSSASIPFTTDVYFDTFASDTNVSFILHWKDFSGNSRKTTASFKVKVAVPSITVSATPDGPVVPGAPVVIRYHVANTGNVTVKNILLQDPTAAYLDSSIIFSAEESLAPGAIFERQATLTLDGEATLSPTATYIYNEQTYTATGAEVKLSATEVIPTLTLSCDNFTASYKGAMHTFNYTITNTTQVTLKNVYVYDSDAEDAGVVDGPIDIEVGAVYTGSYQTPVEKGGYYKFKITYSYDGADGEKQQSAKTEEPLKIPNDILFTIEKATPEKLDDSGEMTFTVLVENGTSAELRNVAIEENSGLIDRIEINKNIPGAIGDTPSQFKYDITVKIPIEATLVQFNLYYTINDELFIINTGYKIEYVGNANTPTEAPVIETPVIGTPFIPNNNGNDGIDLSGLWIWLCIFLLIFLLVFIIILIILKSKKNASTANISVKRKINNAFDDFDYDDYDEFDEDDIETEFISESPDDDFSDNVNNVTTAILGTEEVFGADDDIDDEGVKIYKKK